MKTFRLLFSDDMARAIVSGRKTVTRRPVKGADGYAVAPCHFSSTGFASVDQLGGWCICTREVTPPCAPGDLLIGRECWCPRSGGSLIIDKLVTSQFYRATDGVGDMKKPSAWPWRPSIHMPDWAARIRRRVVSVTVERLQDISEADAVREGFEAIASPAGHPTRPISARDMFGAAWNGIYATKGLAWPVNPWVWRIEFEGVNHAG